MNQTLTSYKNPDWWTEEHDTAWERVKQAMKRDWDQTKHDIGGNVPDTNQKIGNTTRQALGKEVIPPRGLAAQDEFEPAYRFGYGARVNYREEYPEWNEHLENELKREWETLAPERRQSWMQDRAAIRYGWDYDED